MIISFEQLPNLVSELANEVRNMREELQQLSNPKSDSEKYFSLEELMDYLPTKPSKQTVYNLVNRKLIPFRKNTKNLIFLKSEIDNWLNS